MLRFNCVFSQFLNPTLLKTTLADSNQHFDDHDCPHFFGDLHFAESVFQARKSLVYQDCHLYLDEDYCSACVTVAKFIFSVSEEIFKLWYLEFFTLLSRFVY